MRKSKCKEGLSRLLAILIISSTLFGLTACGDNSGSSEPSGTQETSSSQQSSSTKTPEPVASSEEPAIGADVVVPQESTPKTAGSKPEPKAATASEDEWKALYKEVLLNKGTYSEFYSSSGQVDLIDLDQNGIPELYISDGLITNFELCAVYDAATGTLESNKAPDVWFGNNVYKNKNTGAYVLSGENGGTAGYTQFWLLPDINGLSFEQVTGDGFQRSIADEAGNKESTKVYGNFDATDYEAVDGVVKTLTLSGDGTINIPTEEIVCEFLGLEVPETEKESTSENSWIGQYEEYLNNQLNYEGIDFIYLQDNERADRVPELYAGFHAMASNLITSIAYASYEASEPLTIEYCEPPIEDYNEDVSQLHYIELVDGKPTAQEINDFLNSWK